MFMMYDGRGEVGKDTVMSCRDWSTGFPIEIFIRIPVFYVMEKGEEEEISSGRN